MDGEKGQDMQELLEKETGRGNLFGGSIGWMKLHWIESAWIETHSRYRMEGPSK